MGYLFVILVLSLSLWTLLLLFRQFRHHHVSIIWWVAFGLLCAGGIIAGSWCAFYCEYSIGARYRIGSFPIPIVVFHLEQGDWVDFPVPTSQAWLALFTNIITIVAVSLLPLWLVFWRQRKCDNGVAK
jgi:hypothetical protein